MEPIFLQDWNPAWLDRSQTRNKKPRITGITSLIDRGMGLYSFEELLQLAGDYIDFIKLGFGTAAITPTDILQKKIALARQYQVDLYPGGTFFEVACEHGNVTTYFKTVKHFGFRWVEISDGTIEITLQKRSWMIQQAISHGLKVITEIGKKKANSFLPLSEFLSLYEHDLEQGASYVIIEGREDGKNVGLYDEQGQMDADYVQQLIKYVNLNQVIWEAPQKKQHIQLIKWIGNDVNLGNIPPSEVMSLETLRRGLRSDTFYFW
ncbi:phosphosulfolactate synthase [Thermoflavimicrobium daqui]|uniref:Phosphosulfolactate synthase n=1 Tax=Thermoflavimicrobium daqui TaxID=2137476 RepID=A0A364K8F8_9BACL|nr:phosphosulfolactate synthase [Thermoflavimicrobium daqui]RAL26577.1 phosphosulfolactate synthase [Thermoflavimicrobium daqui]